MVVTFAHRLHLQEREVRELQACDSRLMGAVTAARLCAQVLERRWPAIGGDWLFGSTIDRVFGMASGIDLVVQGLRKLDLLDAMAEAESTAAAIPVDQVCLESLSPQWQQRIRECGQRLL